MLEAIGIILGVLGLFGIRELIRFFDTTVMRWWVVRVWDAERVQAEIVKQAKKHVISFPEKKNAASFGPPILVDNFVDFLSAATDATEKRQLERCALRWIRLKFQELPDALAVPKLGNVLYSEAVARSLALPLVIVRQESHLFIRGGNAMEGKLHPGANVLVIDDIGSDGDFLLRCIDQLQQLQATVVGVLVLINRVEGTARQAVLAKRLRFESIVDLSDSDISNWRSERTGAQNDHGKS
jgi:orotate phosphoribosyltransferase